MHKKVVSAVWFPVIVILVCGGCTSLVFRGKVTVKGSEPHTYLVLVAKDTEYKLVGRLQEKIWQQYQGRTIEVRGEIIKDAIGPGFPAELEVTEILGEY